MIHGFLRESTQRYPDKIAAVHQKSSCTYAQLSAWSDVLAMYLRDQGVSKGDRVVLFLDNSIDYLVAYFGILKIGGGVVALNSQLVSRELALLLTDCTPRVLVTDNKHKKVVEEALVLINQDIIALQIDDINYSENYEPLAISPQLSASDLAMIIYTSGTTGKPKGVMLSHENLAENAESIISYLRLTAEDKIMVVLPFYYSYGNSLLTTHIRAGGTLIIDNRFVFPNVILDTMATEEVTGFAGVPTHFNIFLKKSAIRKYQFPKLRYVTQAGGAMSAGLIKEFRQIIPEIKFYVMYGQTEASARLSFLSPDDFPEKAGSIGKAIPGVQLDVLRETGEPVEVGEIGEIVARGKNIMQGYWDDPEQTKGVLREGDLFTGDLARIDADGFIYLISRKKDMIKSGANRISPLELEEVVSQLPGIAECAVVGIPDEILGEAIKLFVVLDDVNVTEKDILIFCKKNLAAFKMPKKVAMVQSLPKTASGKIKREQLKALLAAGRKPQDAS